LSSGHGIKKTGVFYVSIDEAPTLTKIFDNNSPGHAEVVWLKRDYFYQ
jgi:hypothetical protein